ncbi:hypothetical protein tpqmel_0061 [Candidatus Gastranaerophilus sp. (ex Termes propinquus)]|nr:hypothetical protein tpqmel_0061 [Candidatus Gastranaerophilus sp. (ex Termes propinquus)]
MNIGTNSAVSNIGFGATKKAANKEVAERKYEAGGATADTVTIKSAAYGRPEPCNSIFNKMLVQLLPLLGALHLLTYKDGDRDIPCELDPCEDSPCELDPCEDSPCELDPCEPD